MISVMVVEDEMLMRTWLQDEISVIDPEFEVTATAANGRTALELMEKMPIDVLITDIKMPVMDGLTLCEIVNERYPNVQKVILSGYDDFAYAQRSIETNIRGYLLKPVDTKKLKELLERIRKCTELIKMQNRTSSWHVESIPWLCAQYYQAVMLGLGIQMDACTRLIGKTPYLNRYLLLLFAEQTYIDGAVDTGLYGVLQQIASEKNGVVFGDMHNAVVMLIPIDPADEICQTAEKLCLKVQNRMAIPVTAGITAGQGIESLANCYHTALALLIGGMANPKQPFLTEQRHWTPQRTIASFSSQETGKYIQISHAFRSVLSALDSRDYALIRCEIRRLIALTAENTKEKKNHVLLLRGIFVQQYIKCGESARNKIVSVISAETMDEEEIARVLIELQYPCEESDFSNEAGLIEMAKAYILQHYAEPIGLNDVAEWVGVSANYLSSLFHKNSEITYIKYLTNIRMEMAVCMMQANPHMRVNEIASAVGYPNDKYFLNVFRKYYGVTPSQYKTDGIKHRKMEEN